jgi:hypothetical protein
MAGRPENPLDLAAGPVPQFASGLRDLKAATELSYRAMATRAHYSAPALSTAANGRQLPTWEVTEAYVKVCGGDVEEWRERWRATKQLLEPDQKVELPGQRSRVRATFVSSATGGFVRLKRKARVQLTAAIVGIVLLFGAVITAKSLGFDMLGSDSAAADGGSGWNGPWESSVPVYLDVLVPVSGRWSGTSKDASIGGHLTQRALQQVVTGCSGPSSVEYRIGKDYTRLDGRIGIDDNSQSNRLSAQVVLIADGREVLTAVVGYGYEPVSIRLDVRDVDRLQIQIASVGPVDSVGPAQCSDRAVLDFANMTLTPGVAAPVTTSSLEQ